MKEEEEEGVEMEEGKRLVELNVNWLLTPHDFHSVNAMEHHRRARPRFHRTHRHHHYRKR